MNGLVGARLKTAAATHAARGEVLGRAGAGRPQQGQWRRRSRGDRARREDARGGQGGDSRQTHSQTLSVARATDARAAQCGALLAAPRRYPAASFPQQSHRHSSGTLRKPDYFGAQSRWRPSPSRRDSCPVISWGRLKNPDGDASMGLPHLLSCLSQEIEEPSEQIRMLAITPRGDSQPGGPMHLDEHSDTPFYRQLEAQLREGIESGTYPTGSQPPLHPRAGGRSGLRAQHRRAGLPSARAGRLRGEPPRQRVRGAERGLPAAGRLSALLRRAAGRPPAQKPATTSPTATWSPAPSPPPPGGPSPTTSCCRWKPPAATPTTTRSARRACARPLRGGWSRSATSTAPPSRSSCRAAPRPAFRTCWPSSTPPRDTVAMEDPATTACARSSNGRASPSSPAG